jgi:TP901 family phage tail tape measure protein
MATVAEAFVTLRPDASKFGRETETEVSRSITSIGSKMTRTLTPAAAAVGVAFRQIGNDFNAGRNAIIAGTGASGKELEGLEKAMKRVGGRVPQDLGQVGEAVAELNTRLGLSGPALEGMSKQFLDLSRVAGGDVKTNVAAVTRVFGDWDIATENQSSALDTLFKASQLTGAGVDSLSRQVVQFGAPMRQLGFSFEESTALLGKFEQEGVNTELVMGSMRIALGRMARAGEEPIETFQRMVGEIENAGSAGEANAIALELFGARAGPDMAAAIREGRFEIGDLVAQLQDADGALGDAAKRTLRLGDHLSMLKNRVTGAVGPMADMGMAVAGVLAMLGPATLGIGKLTTALQGAGTGATVARSAILGLGVLGGVVAALVGVKMGLDALGWSAKGLVVDIEKAAQATSQELADAFLKMGESSVLAGQQLKAFETIAAGNVGTAIRLRDELKRQGKDTTDLNKIIDQHIAKQKQVKADTEKTTGAVDDLTDSLGEQKSATENLNDAMDDLLDATLAQWSADLQYERQVNNVEDALQDYTKKTMDAAAAGSSNRDATEALERATIDAASAILGQAAAAVEVAAKQAEMENRTLSAAEAAAIQRWELAQVANSLAPDSPLRKRLEGYLADLAKADRVVTTTFTQVYTSPSSGGAPVRRAHTGGVVTEAWPTMPGLRSDERPAVLQVGETVTAKGNAQDPVQFNITQHITTSDPQQVAASVSQRLRDAAWQMGWN